MVTKQKILNQARKAGFQDVGITSAEPFEEHQKILSDREAEYGWAETVGLDLKNGTDPRNILPSARSIIVLVESYFEEAFPHRMESHFGRCYLDDDRVTRDGLAKKIKTFRSYLRENGIDAKIPFNLPHRAAAARAGLGTFGKNCLLYSNRVARQSSWILPIAVVVDAEFEPDLPTTGNGCPKWCRNACIAACPTRALKGDGTIDPRKCVSYLTYFGDAITPLELREQMGLYIYGCDRCQNVCPRNAAWIALEKPMNHKAAEKADDFDLSALLHMDKDYFENRIWPHMFYIPYERIWLWKMNVARVMGNTLDKRYIKDLKRAFQENPDSRVRGMAAWALGRIGGTEAKAALAEFAKSLKGEEGSVRKEVDAALEMCEA